MKWLQKSSRSDTDLHQLTVTALHSTSQTPSWSTHCCFTRRPYHLLQQMWSPELIQLQGHDDQVNSVAFSPDRSKIVSESFDHTIRVWDASTGIEILPPLRGHEYSVTSVAFSPNGSKIISGSFDKTIRV
ncbi:hypothetical protein AX14_008698 [Amanita brunnescens Koide BX004]|nr:hypothetical protein AX14_008698 [Amanita brunnescens Koide BX004]